MTKISGRVVSGDGIGRRLGFPTANLKIPARRRLPRGVWRVAVSGADLSERLALCNIGVRPTLGGKRRIVEVHIPRFRGDLYGRTLTLRFLSPVREERKFLSLKALQQQIRRDVRSLIHSDRRARMNA